MSVDDKYTYPNSGGVLINRFDIRDADLLDRVLNDWVSVGWVELQIEAVPHRLDLAHLRVVHHRLFGDVLPFAGQIRDVDAQAGNVGVAYCRPEFIQDEANRIFGQLDKENYLRGLTHRGFADRLGYYWGEISALHPFRDGNTRAQSVYVTQLATRAGYTIDWTTVDVDFLREYRLGAVAGNVRSLADYLFQRIVVASSTTAVYKSSLTFGQFKAEESGRARD